LAAIRLGGPALARLLPFATSETAAKPNKTKVPRLFEHRRKLVAVQKLSPLFRWTPVFQYILRSQNGKSRAKQGRWRNLSGGPYHDLTPICEQRRKLGALAKAEVMMHGIYQRNSCPVA
jgi:hypothetical protein